MNLLSLISSLEDQKLFELDNFISPIYDEINDPEDLKKSYNKYPIIPPFGSDSNTNDGIISTLNRLSETTPVVSGIVESIKDFTVGAGMTLKRKEGLGVLNKNTVDVSEAEVSAFEQSFLDTFVNTDLAYLSEMVCKALSVNGNAGFLVSVESVTKKSKIQYIPLSRFRYLKESLLSADGVMIANSFNYSDLKEVEPIIVPCYPLAIDNDGLIQTFIPIKKPSQNRHFYGFATGASSLMQQYLLNQLIVYLSAETDGRFTGKVFFDIPVSSSDLEGDEAQDVKDFQENQKNTFTNKGSKKSSIMNFFNVFDDGRKVNITQFEANTEHDFYEKIINLLENQVLKAFSWNKSLIGDNSDSGMFGERLEAVYKGASQRVKPVQKIIENALNNAFTFVEDKTGAKLRNGSILVLNSLYQKMLDDKAKKETKENEAKLLAEYRMIKKIE